MVTGQRNKRSFSVIVHYLHILYTDYEQGSIYRLITVCQKLTHSCQMDLFIRIILMSAFRILGVSGARFHFVFYFKYMQIFLLANSEDPGQTPRSAASRFACPKNGTLCLYGLNKNQK